MAKLIINGGKPLSGETEICGAKNAALPILAATVLCDGISVIHNCPDLSDVDAAVKILSHLGCKCKREGSTVIVDSTGVTSNCIPDDLMREMRSSIVFLGAIAGRTGAADLSFPGGCELGPRPIDLHLAALRQLGVEIDENHGRLLCRTDGIKGAVINLSIPSVGATENIMLAACISKGKTVIHNAAREPEIDDLADFLNKCGADVRGAGSSNIEIYGVSSLSGCEHTVIPDRIIAATYMSAAAVSGGSVVIRNIVLPHLFPVIEYFKEAGCRLDFGRNSLRITPPTRLQPLPTVRTMAYPGFPTDAQPPMLAMSTVAEGTSMFVETIFENRFRYVSELVRMGAKIKVEGRVAVVEGVSSLSGAEVSATDLRGGAAMVVAALAARGTTVIDNISHIERGYEKIENALSAVGADIKCV